MGRHSCSSSLIVLVAALAALQVHAEVELKPLEDLHQHTGDDPRPLEDLNNGTGGNNGMEGNNGTGGVQYIVGGKPTTPKKFPWQMLVVTVDDNNGLFLCGGSIISQTWIMSAAHCFTKRLKSGGFTENRMRIELYAGVTNIDVRNSDQHVQKNTINKKEFKKHLFIHPDYTKGAPFNNDIAIIKLKKSLTFNSRVNSIPLATEADFINGKKLTVSGWGRTTAFGKHSNVLMYVSGLELISRKECKAKWGNDLTDRMICHKTKNKNTCKGDSGGPVITGKGSSNGPPYVQIGIVSFGNETCDLYFPKVFVDVAKFRNWINTMTKAVFKCSSAGLFPYPGNCRKFHLCMAVGGGDYRKYTMNCPSNLYFNPKINVCDHPGNVKSC